jgi:mannose-6-phosphate isomerase
MGRACAAGQKSNDNSAHYCHFDAMKLDVKYVEKPWGRITLASMFRPADGKRIGEIWFLADAGLPLLAKYLFTSERLSVQVHPDDEQARARGLPRGKSECWYILEADPGATIGLGLKHELSRNELRSAALDGSIVELIDWRPVSAGDFLYVPAGTIHAIGGGISLLEFQQNSDLTYRLYDYGRPRELHLEDALRVSRPGPYDSRLFRSVEKDEDVVLADGPLFTLVHAHEDRLTERRRWVLPLEGRVGCGNDWAGAGECLLIDPGERLEAGQARMLIGAAA